MEASTVPASEVSTGSRTIADLLPLAAEKFSDLVAIRHKVDGAWQDVSFREVGEIVHEIALGLVTLGIDPGDRVCILCQTRPEWTYADFGIASSGATVVPIYPTNSPEECEWVVGNSGAKAVICEDAAQIAKIRAVQERLPDLETIVAIDPAGDIGDAISLEDVRARGRREGDVAELERRRQAVSVDDPFTLIYTSGTTGPPKGCTLTHGNYRSIVSMAEHGGVVAPGDVTYLFLPLAHAFALLIQLVSVDVGATIAYCGGDPKQIIPELSETKPTYFPSVPRIFEKLYTLVTQNADREQLGQAVAIGLKVRELERTGQEVPADLRAGFDVAEEKLFKNVRAAFGGNVRQAVTGAAPIAKDILEFFYACGVPVLEGYGMTETSTAATLSTLEEFKFGTVGRPMQGVQVKIADDGEVLLKGDNIFKGYWHNDDATADTLVDGWLHTGDLGSVDDEGYLSITGRKKDIIITAGGKNLTPANLENDLKQSPWISQAVMHGDRRPFPVALITLDEEEIVKWARAQGLPEDIPSLAHEPKVHALVQEMLDEVNKKYANVEQIKKFTILDHDLSQETGELTPTLKVKRNVVQDKYAAVLDAMYAS